MRDAFGEIILDLAESEPRLVVLDSDVGVSTRTDKFRQQFPERHIQVGIAEQNMIGIAAGLSTIGYIPLVSTFAAFAVRRTLDQLVTSVAYPKLNVKICAGYSGLSSGRAGSTHHATEELAVMRAIPGLTIISPGTVHELKQALTYAVALNGPIYIRIHRNFVEEIMDDKPIFVPGKGYIVRNGSDLAIFTTGPMIHQVIEAAKELYQRGINATVVHMPTVKPLDRELIIAIAVKIRKILTVEDQNQIGGFGSAICEIISEYAPAQVFRLGIPDTFCESGSEPQLLNKYGIDICDIISKSQSLMDTN